MDVCSLKLLYKDTSLEKVSQTEHNVLHMLLAYRILIEMYMPYAVQTRFVYSESFMHNNQVKLR